MTDHCVTYDLYPLGDRAVVIQFSAESLADAHQRISALCDELERNRLPGVTEWVAGYETVTIYYDPVPLFYRGKTALSMYPFEDRRESPYVTLCSLLHSLAGDLSNAVDGQPRVVEIPVCYGADFGPDLPEVAKMTGLTADEVVHIHSNTDYLVHMIGFAPGFPYLGGMNEAIAVPRRASPRPNIPAGSVGIAGKQTGVYPISTPGGWRIIGRTPLALFRPAEHPPSLLRAGDTVRFRSITPEEFRSLEAKERGRCDEH